jgi:hypothetical protein
MGIEFTRQSAERRAFLDKLFPEGLPAPRRQTGVPLHPAA